MLAKVARLGLRDWTDFARAHVALLGARVRLATSPVGSLVAREDLIDDGPPEAAVTTRAQSLAVAVERAARFGGVRPSCLVRSLALQQLLRGEGMPDARVRVGVRRRPDGELMAHAWVTYGAAVLSDPPESVAAYRTLDHARVGWTR